MYEHASRKSLSLRNICGKYCVSALRPYKEYCPALLSCLCHLRGKRIVNYVTNGQFKIVYDVTN